MKNKFFLGAAITALFVLGWVLAVIGQSKAPANQTVTASNSSAPGLPGQGSGLASETMAASQPPVAVSGKMKGIVIKDSDIQHLALGLGIQIPGSANPGAFKAVGKVDSRQWTQAVQQAQELLQGMCTCHQRNWLLQFIDCGNYALAGDPKYNEAMQDLAAVPLTE